MKLSTAIRKGAEQHTQVFSQLFDLQCEYVYNNALQYTRRASVKSTCVIGAALVGVFGSPQEFVCDSKAMHDFEDTNNRNLSELGEIFPILKMSYTIPVDCTGAHFNTLANVRRAPLLNILVHLNDAHHWSREQIADWVETLEIE